MSEGMLGQPVVAVLLDESGQRAVGKRRPVTFFGRAGGLVPSVEDVMDEIKKLIPETKR